MSERPPMTTDDVADLAALIDAGELARATDATLRRFGPEILGWLHASLPAGGDAADAFSLFAEELWRSLPRYQGRCSPRTWCYMLARQAAHTVRTRRGSGGVPLSRSPVSALAADVRETTSVHLRTEVKDRVRALRSRLDEDDQLLLILRVDKDLGWRDIALVLLGEGAPVAEIERLAPTLRKRFERIKQRLRELVAVA
jgi:RNA polymerase sigma-70 factor (ECF subfamily)